MIRVMLVDDEPNALDLLEILLTQIGGVEVAGRFYNPVQAFRVFVKEPVDAVFLDYDMPGLTGMETARKMREIRPHVPIVFTTAHSEFAVEAFEIQAADYLLKPLTLSRLEMTVSRLRQAVPGGGGTAGPVVGRAGAGMGQADMAFIRCMGGFSIALPDDPNRQLSWKTNKEKEVCAFLVHHGEKPVDTALIIESVWPGYDLGKAKTYLYTCLSYLRKSFQEHRLPMRIEKSDSGFAIRMNGAAADVTALEGMLNDILLAETPDDSLYGIINELYKGAYMEGCDYRWAVFRQEEINAKFVRALRSMHRVFRRQGNPTLAEDSLRRLLAIAPDSEADGRELIRLHLETGNRGEALRVYRRLEQVIRGQLGVDLEEETVRLYRQLGPSEEPSEEPS